MLQVFKTPVEKFKESKNRETQTAAMEYIRELYPDKMAHLGSEQAQQVWVDTIVKSAQHHNFTSEKEVFSYIRAVISFGEDFHRLPWAQKILNLRAPSLEKSERLDNAIASQLEDAVSDVTGQYRAISTKDLDKYLEEKSDYVYSFSGFYGLQLESVSEAMQWVVAVVQEAYQYNITANAHLDSYIEVAMHFGQKFNQRPWAKKILSSPIKTTKRVNVVGFLL